MAVPSILVALLILAGAVAFGATREQKIGTFLGIPYDWRRPTRSLIRERFWNPDDRRVLTPKVFGWGWSISFAAIARRLRGG
jgi:hypothetical protein